MAEDEVFEDELDPRIKGELDLLNQSTDDINALETTLVEYRRIFKSALDNATQRLQNLAKKLGKSIERARPYFTAKAEVAQAQLALQRAVHNFQRANGVHRAAKETISLAESRLSEFEDKKVDAAWQEVLNMQTMRFMEAEKDRTRSEQLHERATKKFEFLEKKMQAQRKKHKTSTKKAKPYFELKDLLEIDLQRKRHKVEDLQRKVEGAKKRYRQSLNNLENISAEIHEKRRQSTKMLGDDSVDSQLPINPLDLNLVGLKTYDDIDQLEADLDEFNIEDDDEEELSSGSESDGDSDGSSPSIKGKRSQLKRSNTAPAQRFEAAGMAQRKSSRQTLKQDPRVMKRAASVNIGSRSSQSKHPSDSDDAEGADVVFEPSIHDMTAIRECVEDSFQSEEGEEKDEATYRRLHGTNINQERGRKPALPPKPKNLLATTEDYDIFDELC